ncbi:hypothetical protein ARHIZOSPH14_11810 [Agromyces rhizosphaerae]|uniref:Diadenosine tetraphosphate (Ap4A) HIT family hydrolase n=1 Tax=Agromyces rhizosphaerae TaxID=88374 RepID=A0A9W6FNG1_9MICO|nr:hypothetical protein [Agromyces rhizosphaerae]GLI26939.1 hypothetical protein ARHIZOSPH14_11810 [Agromyces rhizosphaerae]
MSGCLPCELEHADASAIVYRDERWACEVAEGYDVPGWFVLRLRRHAEGWGGLSATDAAEFGVVSQRIATAVQEATGAPNVYFLSFGENHRHFHFLVIARPADLDPTLTGAAILAMRSDHRDPTRARSIAAAVGDAISTRVAASRT